MSTAQTIFSLADTLARSLAYPLWGEGADEDRVSDLGLRLAMLLDTNTTPCPESVSDLEPVYGLDHFAISTGRIIKGLLKSYGYGEGARMALYEGQDRITLALLVLHISTGLLSVPAAARLQSQIWPARLQTFVAGQN